MVEILVSAVSPGMRFSHYEYPIPQCPCAKEARGSRCPITTRRCVTKVRDGWYDTWTREGLWWVCAKGEMKIVEIRFYPDLNFAREDDIPGTHQLFDMGWDCESTPYLPNSWWTPAVMPTPPKETP